MVVKVTPSRAMQSTPPATVLSMSRSFMSRKTRLSGRRELLDEREPAGEDELHADLVEARALAERGDEPPRLGDARNVERDDQPVARVARLRSLRACMS